MIFRCGLVALLLSAFAASACGQAPNPVDRQAAAAIVESAGARQGLCIHLGCGGAESPGLIAELAAESGFLVHGIALDDASFERAKKAIDARGMAGRATVERAPVSPLPYLNDLARVVVVEDFAALAAQGLTKEEILRVTAPDGALLVREGATWIRTVKLMPKEMDEWTHPQHGPDGNKVSTDSALKLPVGLRWQDGLPVVATFRAGTGAYAAAGGRLFTVGVNELENLSTPSTVLADHTDPYKQKFSGYPQYLTARDAFSGIPLWKVKLSSFYDGGAGNSLNALPLVATSRRVFAAGKEGIVVVDAGSGKILAEYGMKYTPARLLVIENVVVAAGWESKFRRDGNWTWLPKKSAGTSAGSVEAFEADTGKPLWSLPATAFKIVASGGAVYLEIPGGEPPASTEIVALDLRTGKERWRISREKLGAAGDFSLDCAGPGFVTVFKAKEKTIAVLSAADGSNRFEVPNGPNWAAVVDGLLWLNGKKYDPETGAIKGDMPTYYYGDGCQQCSLSAGLVINGWGFMEIPVAGKKRAGPAANARGFRPGCVMCWMPAYGMGYTSASPCCCVPGAAYGFVAVGPSGEPPAASEFEKPRSTEKGPAFGPVSEPAPEADGWCMFRHDVERSAATTAKVPDGLKELWRATVATAGEDILSNAWRSLATPLISAPVVSGGRAFVTISDLGQVVALDAATGKPAWTSTLGSRLTGPPTLYRGLCVIGCHDGWVYALRTTDGQVAWRTRIAPWERRMVAFGRVESVWPALGPVLVHDGVLYATAGRTSEAEGGVALAALDPATGSLIWAKAIAPGPQRVNDVLSLRDGLLCWHYMSFNPKDGTVVAPTKIVNEIREGMLLQGAMLDSAWTLIPAHRRAGKTYLVGKLYASQLAWNEKTVVSPKGGIPREKTGGSQKPTQVDNTVWTKETRPLPEDDKAWAYSWRIHRGKSQQVEALVLTANAALYAGRDTDAKTGKATGFFWIVSLETGETVAEFALESPPACDGLAVAGERVYVSLANGALLCYGK